MAESSSSGGRKKYKKMSGGSIPIHNAVALESCRRLKKKVATSITAPATIACFTCDQQFEWATRGHTSTRNERVQQRNNIINRRVASYSRTRDQDPYAGELATDKASEQDGNGPIQHRICARVWHDTPIVVFCNVTKCSMRNVQRAPLRSRLMIDL
jgi:hypothetical protein